MPYTPQTWTDLPSTTTPISAARLTYMETGIDDAHTIADAAAPLASPAFTGNPTAPTQSAGNNSTRLATTAYVDTAVSTANSVVTANTQTASYVLVLSDAGKVIEMNVASGNTLTVPPNSSVAFPVGTVIEVYQMGAGQVTLTPGSGVTIRGASMTTRAQYSTVALRKRATDEWVASGDLT